MHVVVAAVERRAVTATLVEVAVEELGREVELASGCPRRSLTPGQCPDAVVQRRVVAEDDVGVEERPAPGQHA